MIELNKIYEGDSLTVLKTFPSEIFNTCVTSPPYYGLRNYGVKGQMGLESTPEEYIEKMVLLFREVKRTLREDGTLWLNIGDSYASGKGTCHNPGGNTSNYNVHLKEANVHPLDRGNKSKLALSGLKPKDLIGIPWALAFALRTDGWYLRQDIIWYKRNPMPESVTDRCTKAHEYIFLLSKSANYYYDAKAIATPYKDKTLTTFGCEVKGNGDESGLVKSENWGNDIKVRKPKEWKTPDEWDTGKGSHGSFHKEGREKGQIGYVPKRNPRPNIDTKGGNQGNGGIPIKGYAHRGEGDKTLIGHSGNLDSAGNLIGDGLANKKSVWDVPTKPFKAAHFATFPEELIADCIKAGCPEGGLVLDPFGGANTTGVVSRKLNRNYVAIELNPAYIEIGKNREREQIGLFL